MKFFIGLLLVVSSLVLILKTEWFINNFGHSAWAENKFGTSGGTRTMYKLMGLAGIFFGFLLITGLLGGFLGGTVIKLFVR